MVVKYFRLVVGARHTGHAITGVVGSDVEVEEVESNGSVRILSS